MGILQNKIMKDLAPMIEQKFDDIVKKNQEEANKKLCDRLDTWDEMVRENVRRIIIEELDKEMTKRKSS